MYRLLLIGLLISTNVLLAQRDIRSDMSQCINVEGYPNKKFVFSGSLAYKKINQRLSRAYLFVNAKKTSNEIIHLDDTKGVRVASGIWERVQIKGTIAEDVDSLQVGAKWELGNDFSFDGFELKIETNPGVWEIIPLKNGGFEQWSRKGTLEAWGGNLYVYNNFIIRPDSISRVQGNTSLHITTDGYQVENVHEITEVWPEESIDELLTQKLSTRENLVSITQDYQGFIWIGTENGIIKYDAYTYKKYKNDPDDPLSLSGNIVTKIYEDRAKNLWIGTLSGGLNLYDRKTESFQRYRNDPNDSSSISQNDIWSIYEDSKGRLWIGTRTGGLNLMNKNKGTFKRFTHLDSNLNKRKIKGISTICEDSLGNLWVAIQLGGMAKFDPAMGTFDPYLILENNSQMMASLRINSSYVDEEGMFWLGSYRGLLRFDPYKGNFTDQYFQSSSTQKGISPNIVGDIIKDSSNTFIFVWVGGISKFHIATQIIERFDYGTYFDRSNSSSAILIDQSGFLWNQRARMLFYMDPYEKQFKRIAHVGSQGVNLLDSRLEVILEDMKGYVWAIAEKGILRLLPGSKRIEIFQNDPQDAQSLALNSVSTIFETSEGETWIALSGGGLDKFIADEGTFEHIGRLGEPALGSIRQILEDQDQNLLLATGAGLFRFKPTTKEVIHLPQNHLNQEDFGPLDITRMYIDRSGNLWLGMISGILKKYDPEKNIFHVYNPIPNTQLLGFSKYAISCFWEDKEGKLWLGTHSGLLRFDPKNEEFSFFNIKEGLGGNIISAIQGDNHGNLWIATDKGLSKFDPKTASFRNYTQTDGLPSDEILQGIKSINSSDLYFGSANGLFHFNPDILQDNPHAPPIVFTSLKRYNSEDKSGEAIVVKGISVRDTLFLSYTDDILQFEFAALGFSKTEKNQYKFKLEGLNEEWIHLGTKREITLIDLAPGKHTLKVIGSNGDGIWNERGRTLIIIVSPPWFWNPWIKSIYLLLLCLGIYALYRIQLGRQLEKAETKRLRELDQFKTRLYTDISHQIRTPLTVIQGMNEKIKSHPEKWVQRGTDLISRNNKRLLRLVNQMLDLSKLEAGKLVLKPIHADIIPFLYYLADSFHSIAEIKEIELSLDLNPESLYMDYDPDRLADIISNLLSNAIKYTSEGGKVSITSQKVSDALILKVEDTGMGIDEQKIAHIFNRFYQATTQTKFDGEGTGIGLSIVQELVKLMQGEISVTSKIGEGTCFRILLPISKKSQLIGEQVLEKYMALDAQEPIYMYPNLPDPLDNSDLPTALIVEDHKDVVEYLAACLENQYQIQIAHNGKQGIERALDIIPDIIISDVMMPIKDGYELCNTLKQDIRTSHIPIILLTAKADTDSKIEGLKKGADAYLKKPFHEEELLVRIRKLLELRASLQEKYTSDDFSFQNLSQKASLEDEFIIKVKRFIETHIDDVNLDVGKLCKELAISRSPLHKKLKILTGKSTTEFIRFVRLQKARQLLLQTNLQINEIAYDTGFQNPNYFTRRFGELYGLSPKEFRSKHKK